MSEKINNFLKKYKLWLSILIIGILIAVAFFFVAYKLMGKIKTVSNIVQEKTLDNESNQSRIAKIPEMEAAQRSFLERETDLDATLNEDAEIDFIKKLEALAEVTGNRIGLKIDEADQKKTVAKKGDKDAADNILANLPSDNYITVQISLEGGYSELINFIHKIENFSYYLNIVSINAVKNASRETETQSSGSPFNASRSGEKIPLEKETLKTTITVAVYLKK